MRSLLAASFVTVTLLAGVSSTPVAPRPAVESFSGVVSYGYGHHLVLFSWTTSGAAYVVLSDPCHWASPHLATEEHPLTAEAYPGIYTLTAYSAGGTSSRTIEVR